MTMNAHSLIINLFHQCLFTIESGRKGRSMFVKLRIVVGQIATNPSIALKQLTPGLHLTINEKVIF
jgi:hypothetical protein